MPQTQGLLIKGGTVVDGTGAAARRADVRVAARVIAEIGPDLDSRRRIGDRRVGCIRDAGMDRVAHPLRRVDVVGSVVRSDAGTRHDHGRHRQLRLDGGAAQQECTGIDARAVLLHRRPAVARVHARGAVELGDAGPSTSGRSTRARRRSTRRCSSGHQALRTHVMGEEAWERAATSFEVDAMCVLLDEALRHGGIGLSTTFMDTDRNNREVPSRKADDAEFGRLLDVVARHPGATFQFVPRFMQPEYWQDDFDRMVGVVLRPEGSRPTGAHCAANSNAPTSSRHAGHTTSRSTRAAPASHRSSHTRGPT